MVSTEDQQALCDYFYNTVKEDLQKTGYTIVEKPGPDVMRLQHSTTGSTGSTTPLPQRIRFRPVKSQ
jgi:Protein of unknown function (DUF3313)